MTPLEPLESRRLLASGDMDLTFGDNGIVFLPQLNGGADNANVVAAGGDQFFFTGVSRIYKRDADGVTLNSFGGDGQVDLPFQMPMQVVPLSGGDILVLGETSVTTGGVVDTTFFLTRLNADGGVDNQLGGDGVIVLNQVLSPAFRFPVVGVQSDGKIIVAGWTSQLAGEPGEGAIPEITISRLNVDGTKDGTFTEFKLSSIAVAALAVQADDKIFIGGDLTVGDGDPFAITRLNAGGTLDTDFGTDGFIPQSIPGGEFKPDDILVLPGGGFLASIAASDIRKFSADGTQDLNFHSDGETGRSFITHGGSFNGHVIAAPGGKFVTFGHEGINRINADGTLDESFGRVRGGFKAFDFTGAAVASNGDVIVGVLPEQFDEDTSGMIRLQGDEDQPARVSVSGSTVSILGTEAADNIELVLDYPGDPSGEIIIVFVDQITRFVERAGITTIDIAALGGDDIVNLVQENINARISGGDGNDRMLGGSGNDTISGNAQRDRIQGGQGDDRIGGNGGRDKLDGGSGDDRLFGGASGDWLFGGDGADILKGEGGNDRIDGSFGVDTMAGGAGDDNFFTLDFQVESLFGDGGSDAASHDEDDILNSIEGEIDLG